ncbi:MAG: inositol monophosphatase family protein [Candidatus Omnitrophica bacterium]|nr:inositol monophosphatase family protein [Candidatus Omnitrophota bacterium]
MSTLYKKVAIEAALKSGRFIKNSVGKIKKISYKGRINLVTDVDKKSEDIIIKKIRSAFPDHSILSEESSPRYGNSEFKWIIDPLDGTTNFAHSFPFFCVSIALEKDGKVILGVIYDPMRKELFFAEHKKAAYRNNKKIHVSAKPNLSNALLATGFAYGIKEAKNNNIEHFRKLLMRVLAIRRAGSAALDFCYVACGRFDGFWELDLCPWDCAAGALIVREAGGMVTKLDGSAYSHYDKEVLASNGIIHKQMVKVFKG